ncbi:MAG: GSCFA domain-containing protein [Magnetococcales bacterium]|nr:GSCFA domain-containing protein [Magnetococcales bacterium]
MPMPSPDAVPPSPEAIVDAALGHYAIGNMEQAWTLLEGVLVAKTLFAHAFEQLLGGASPAVIQAEMLAHGFGAAAVESQLQRAQTAFQDPFLAQLTAGAIAMSRDAPRLAEEKFRRALALHPHHARAGEVWDLLGWSLLNQGRYTQALAAYDALLALHPDHPTARQSRQTIVDLISPLAEQDHTGTGSHRLVYTRIPETLESLADLDQTIATHVLNHVQADAISLSTQSRIVTIGSCFAASVTRALRAEGVHAVNLTVGEEANNTFTNRMIVEHACQGKAIQERFLPDPTQPGAMRHALLTADLLIYTLGVAPCFFEQQTGQFSPNQGVESIRGVARGRYIFRNTTVEENVHNLLAMIDAIRAQNPSCQFVFSLSPVPLYATLERRSVIEADCLSKSILRVAIEQVVSTRPHCIYWPAFEMVRWLGAYFPGMYGKEDGSVQHVSEDMVRTIMRHFLRVYGPTTSRCAPVPDGSGEAPKIIVRKGKED